MKLIFQLSILLLMFAWVKTYTYDVRNQGILDISTITLPSNITKVLFTGNLLTQIPAGYFQHLPFLENIKLDSNALNVVANFAFSAVSTVTSLSLNKNNLEIITSHMLKGLFNLERLDLDENAIHTLEPGCLSDTTKLVDLWLWRNQLQTLSQNIFDLNNHPTALGNFYMDENLLVCDCGLKWILDADGSWLTLTYKSTTICSGPGIMAGQNWNYFAGQSIECENSTIRMYL